MRAAYVARYMMKPNAHCTTEFKSTHSRLHYALTEAPQRALYSQSFTVVDIDYLADAVCELQGILPMLVNLRHLKLELAFLRPDQLWVHNVICTLSDCTFSLQSCEVLMNLDDHASRFLRQQHNIESIAIVSVEHTAGWQVPADTLLRLKYLRASYRLVMSIFHTPHMFTHLGLTDTSVGRDELQEVLLVYRHQLVGLKYARDMICAASAMLAPWEALSLAAMPNLKYLEVFDRLSDMVSS